MSVEKLQAIPYVLFSILAAVVLVYLISKYFYIKLLASLEVCDLPVMDVGSQGETIYAVNLGVHFNTRVLLSRTHQTSSYWLPFFAFVTEWDPTEMSITLLSQVLKNKTKGKKLVLIDDMKGNLKVYTQKEPA